MANPNDVTCTANAWTKVATGITDANIEIVKDTVNHYFTYKLTAQGAPVGLGTEKFVDEWISIHNTDAIDVYVYAKGSVDGLVRVYA
jgi:hypothetical protein